jgi:hypothetical protein
VDVEVQLVDVRCKQTMISGAHGIEHLESLLESQYTSLGALPFNLCALESTEVIVPSLIHRGREIYNLSKFAQKPRGALALDEYFIFRLYTMSIGAPVRELWLERFRVQMWRF